MNAQQLAQLNQHPLNQAARRRLEFRGRGPLRDTPMMHLLELAHLGLVDQDPDPDPLSEENKVLSDWGLPNQERQAEALSHLEGSLTPDWVEKADPRLVANQILDTLKGANR